MTFVQHLVHSGAPGLSGTRHRLRATPRFALGSGERVGASLRLPASMPIPVAFGLACELARSSCQLVSLAIRPPFQDLPGMDAAALLQAGVPAEQLEITVSRTAAEQAGIEALLALSAMRDQGIGIALRGFGARTAGLVSRLPLSAVIFAPGAVGGVPGSAEATTSLAILLHFAAKQGLRSIVTGIGTEAQRAVLSGLACDAGEGDLFGAAVQTRAAA